MERVNAIRNNEIYQKAMMQNESYERNRSYCQHGFVHQMDVARIAYILILEKGLKVDKEVVYATALLHDIGRYLEYEGKMSHHEASAMIAEEILNLVGYKKEEIELIVETILKHRSQSSYNINMDNANTSKRNVEFYDIFYQADKLSRNCFQCQESASCNWPEDRKNKGIIV